MRLSASEISALTDTLVQFVPKEHFTLYLYGSRLSDDLKGGDIDLLCVVAPNFIQELSAKHSDILVSLKKRAAIGQRRIDLKFCLASDLMSDPFLKNISANMKKIGGSGASPSCNKP